ncbi:MAG: hypothetical protein ACE37E_10425 [Hyphomicrobiales bacterium]
MIQPPRIFNLHQQKAGGKTIESALQRRLGGSVARVSKVFPDVSVGDISKYLDATRAQPDAIGTNVKVVTGHFFYGLHKSSDVQFTYTTVIREPVSRLKSYFNYVMNGEEDYFLRQYFVKNEIGFEQFVRLGDGIEPPDCPSELAIIADNGQSRLLHGTPAPLGHKMTQAEFDVVQTHLEDDFALVAPTDRVSEFVVLLFGLIGEAPPAFLPKVNTQETDWVGTIPYGTRAYIRARHHHDVALYDYASKRFAAQETGWTSRAGAALIDFAGRMYTNYWQPRKQRK